MRKDSKFHSKACRQSHWRFARHGVVAPRAKTPLSLAYADPVYPGKAHLYKDVGDHPDCGKEVDHRALIASLRRYDGWALSTSSSPGLQLVLTICSELELPVRVASWHRGSRKVKSLRPWRSWEAVVYRGGRRVDPAGVSDAFAFVSRPRSSDPGHVIGAKPAAFCFWIFRLLGARAGDTLDDLFPGSGGVSRAWRLYCSGDA